MLTCLSEVGIHYSHYWISAHVGIHYSHYRVGAEVRIRIMKMFSNIFYNIFFNQLFCCTEDHIQRGKKGYFKNISFINNTKTISSCKITNNIWQEP